VTSLQAIFEVIFFKKKYEVICMDLKNTLFKGGALGALSHEAKFQQDAKI
jgi:hypothetical protein